MYKKRFQLMDLSPKQFQSIKTKVKRNMLSSLWSPELFRFWKFLEETRKICLRKNLSRIMQKNNRNIVKILNLFIIHCTHLYYFFLVSIHYLQCIHCLLHYVTEYLIGNNKGYHYLE